MVKHIVFFKLSQPALTDAKLRQLKRLEQIFSSLGQKIPYIVEYRTGINFNKVDYAWDFAIDSVFSNKEDLLRYQESEEHQEAIRKSKEIKKSKAVIDYEF